MKIWYLKHIKVINGPFLISFRHTRDPFTSEEMFYGNLPNLPLTGRRVTAVDASTISSFLKSYNEVGAYQRC